MDKIEFVSEIERFYNRLVIEKGDYLSLFSELQIQIEGWFRGELFNYIDKKVISMSTENREAKIGEEERKKVDLRIKLNNKFYWIELKHLLVGYQLHQPFSLGTYFGNKGYVTDDINKLPLIKNEEVNYLYSLVFVSTNYKKDDCKDSNMKKEIHTESDLKSQFDDIMDKKPEIKKNIDLTSWEYNDHTHFGYLLLRVKNDNEKIR